MTEVNYKTVIYLLITGITIAPNMGQGTVQVCTEDHVQNVSHVILDNEKAPRQEDNCVCVLTKINHTTTGNEAKVLVSNENDFVEFIIHNKTYKSNKDNGNITLPNTGDVQIQYHQSDKFSGQAAKLEIVLENPTNTFNVICYRKKRFNETTSTPSTTPSRTSPENRATSTASYITNRTENSSKTSFFQNNNDSQGSDNALAATLGASVAVLALVAVIIVLLFIFRNRRNTGKVKKQDENVETENPMYNVPVKTNVTNVAVEQRQKIEPPITFEDQYREPSDEYCRIASACVGHSGQSVRYVDSVNFQNRGSLEHYGYASVRHSGPRVISNGQLSNEDSTYSRPFSKSAESRIVENTSTLEPSDETAHGSTTVADNVYNRTTEVQKIIPFNEYSKLKNVPVRGHGASNHYDTTDGVKYLKPERQLSEQDEVYDITHVQ